ncbi:kinase-like protein [Neurospora crassa]|uniref:Protein kinase domain-containing protein n=1 Tax=Neurospora crassa (strain ATCC 24698 / 74-OR23-1A / CBS 708.71 / DSM 1257 / FGSC 987) TaxID=367110 RepID=A7UWU1_NEUCR|nr:hypothetical protein NCU11331 [Neurospora crassa OR74A]EDO65088.1 hypothetical protein NCU11331 [Neurospora crassa OR74A]KHE80054.1 kinase-like protein [Neurospora crassa]|eukprot:XP_001728179.1 hypothetical protein NCU11331 [Neurospora crassa OR74A]
MAPRVKAIGLADPRVDKCSDCGNQYYDDDHPIERPNTDIVPQDSGPEIFDIIREELEAQEVEKGKGFFIPRSSLQEIFTPGRLLAAIQQLWKDVPEEDHQRLCIRVLHESHDGNNKEVTFALKRLHASDKEAFDKELASLISVKTQKSTHLIKLLTTFSVIEEDGGSEVFYLLFPWAEGNLWKYWKVHQPRNQQERLTSALWMAQQCHQLARALLCVHNERQQTLKLYEFPAGKDELYGRHGDIKAENVLYFESDGMLVLSDFGLGRLHNKYSRSNADPKALEKSATYRAPEFDLARGRISRASDVFSLGCMFLEFVTWQILGYDAVYDEFPTYRMEEDITHGFESDIFFKVEGETAIIKPKVHEWMVRLKQHENASEYTKQFLDVIEEMLSPYPKDRINVVKLESKLYLLRRTCETDTSYYGALHS